MGGYNTGASSGTSGYDSGAYSSSGMSHNNMRDMSFSTNVSRPYWMLDD
jgi:hypothetical protein